MWKWSNPFGATSFALQGGVVVTPYFQPPNAQQPGGGLIATNDARNLGANWSSGTVYGTHTIGCNPGTGAVLCVQWYQLSNLDTGTLALVQESVVASNGQFRFFPNLAVDRAGNLGIGYAYSSSEDYAGVHYTGRLASDPLGSLQPEAVLKAGETTVVYNARYGDYAGTALDPNGCTVWHLEEYASSGSAVWGTWVGSFGFSGCAATPPAVTTNAAASVTATAATLNGNLTSLGTATTVNVSFDYGTTTSYGSTTAAQAKTAVSPFSAAVSGLAANTTYHFRAKAVGDDTVSGSDMTFTTTKGKRNH